MADDGQIFQLSRRVDETHEAVVELDRKLERQREHADRRFDRFSEQLSNALRQLTAVDAADAAIERSEAKGFRLRKQVFEATSALAALGVCAMALLR